MPTPVTYVVEILNRQGYRDIAAQVANFEKVADLEQDVWGEHRGLVTRAVELADELHEHAHSVFVTAREGGIDYWCEIRHYRWWDQTKPAGERDDLDTFEALVYEPDGDEDDKGNAPTWRINREVIYKGLMVAAAPDSADELRKLAMSATTREVARDLLAGRDADYDADVADQIVQLALFGEVVYG